MDSFPFRCRQGGDRRSSLPSLVKDYQIDRGLLRMNEVLGPEQRYHYLRFRARSCQKIKTRLFFQAKVLAMLNHPNIICYYDTFEENGVLMIEMEYADDGTLSQFLSKRVCSLLRCINEPITIALQSK